MKKTLILLLSLGYLLISCQPEIEDIPNPKVHTFYYNWYGNPEHDGEYSHWNHEILPHWSDTTWDNAEGFTGGDNIGANFYPELGCYSSKDTAIIAQHMQMMKDAGIGVMVLTWWGKGSYSDHSAFNYLEFAEEYGLKMAFHIEPFYKTADEFKSQLQYINEQYGNHPALYLHNGKPLHYIYDSYKLDIEEWQKVLSDNGSLSVRNSELDATFIGLWVEENEDTFFLESGFDGFYTYFASDGFVYGSTTTNWQRLSDFANAHNKIFIPCAGPGYIDTRIRPWNAQNTKNRDRGAYYENMLNSALSVNPDFIGITSFNEWHEGTQIEPAIPKSYQGYTYDDYSEVGNPSFYLQQTKLLLQDF
jgi:glycoprotein endo-alpha-1,2-mannosidase